MLLSRIRDPKRLAKFDIVSSMYFRDVDFIFAHLM